MINRTKRRRISRVRKECNYNVNTICVGRSHSMKYVVAFMPAEIVCCSTVVVTVVMAMALPVLLI